MKTAEPLHAIQHITPMRGGSQSHLIRASDDNLYVTKFKNNPQHIRILANEYLAGKLGVLVGLPVPEVRIIEVSEGLISNTPELRIQIPALTQPCAAGLQLGCRYVADPMLASVFDYLPASFFDRLRNRADFARMLAFDKWTGNCDARQAIFWKLHRDRLYTMAFIDQGHCFNAEAWTFPDNTLSGVYHKNEAYEDVKDWESFEPVLAAIENIQISQIWAIAREIPAEWYQSNTGMLSSLVERLFKRRSRVRDLITSFRTSSRDPFPNWMS